MRKTERMLVLEEAAIAAAKADGVVSTLYSSARAIWALWWTERDAEYAREEATDEHDNVRNA